MPRNRKSKHKGKGVSATRWANAHPRGDKKGGRKRKQNRNTKRGDDQKMEEAADKAHEDAERRAAGEAQANNDFEIGIRPAMTL